ncbi:hypothetical protein ACFFK0_10540 [Paenibacillus chartarius]|uniref:Flagellar protein FliT n=1 Tax=Paenibacillus chartarius TaxID=747481 RepID=A0ABV6DJS3_9BACL
MNKQSQYESLFEQLRDSAQSILVWLDAEDDDRQAEEITKIQLRQEDLRNQIDSMAQQTAQTPAVKKLIAECIALESEANLRMQALKQWLSEQIVDMRNGVRVRDAYQRRLPQYEGYFVDKHK